MIVDNVKPKKSNSPSESSTLTPPISLNLYGLPRRNYQDSRPYHPGHKFDPEEGLTRQADLESCDINTVLKTYARTGELPNMIKRDPQYGDFSQVADFQTAQNIVLFAQEQFAALDAPVRKRFNNDPAEFLAFANDPENGDEMVKLGLATKRENLASKGKPDGSGSIPASPKGGESNVST